MNIIKETTLHPDGNEGVDLYPKTNINQVQELPQRLNSMQTQMEQLNSMQTQMEQLNNSKLTKPTTPTADSAVTMLADGTVGTKLLSEIGCGSVKLYKHQVKAFHDHDNMYSDIIECIEYRMNNTQITDIGFFSGKYCYAEFNSSNGKRSFGIVSATRISDIDVGLTGVVGTTDGTAEGIYGVYEFQSISDTVTEI